MSALWRLLTGTDSKRPRHAPKPRTGLRPEVSALEGRQLMAVSMGVTLSQGTTLTNEGQQFLVATVGPTKAAQMTTSNGSVLRKAFVVPPVQASPQVLFPADGRYVPIKVSGGVSSTYAMNLDGAYSVFPKPAHTARVLAQLPLPDPTVMPPTPVTESFPPSTFTATVAGSKTPVTIPYTIIEYTTPSVSMVDGIPVLNGGLGLYSVTLPGFKYPETYGFIWSGSLEQNKDGTYVMQNGNYVISPQGLYQASAKDLPISDYEKLVIDERLNSRRGPADVAAQVTDQYRQDEPQLDAPLSLLTTPTVEPFGAPVTVFANAKAGIKYSEQVSIPTAYAINRYYSYSFTIQLQAMKHAGTGGRQYILNVASEDADDGGTASTAVVVPNNA